MIYESFTDDFRFDSEANNIDLTSNGKYVAGDESFSAVVKINGENDCIVDIAVCGFISDAKDDSHTSTGYSYWGKSVFHLEGWPEEGHLVIKTENHVYEVKFVTDTIEGNMAYFKKLIINGVDLNTLNDT